MLTNAHLLSPAERETGRLPGGQPLLRVRVEGKAGGHSWHEAIILHVFSGDLSPTRAPIPCL